MIGATMAAGEFVYSVDESSFQTLVLERSMDVPVVVDFWAPWCGPCRSLGPILEKLAEEYAGGFILAKINTDENQELAMAFQVEGIPAVYAVKNQQVVDQFVGLMPEAQIKEWLKRVGATLKAATEKAPEQPPEPPADEATLRKQLESNSDDSAARVKLAKLLLDRPGTTDEIHDLLKLVEPGEHSAEAERIKALVFFRDVPSTDSDLTQAQVLAESQAENPAVLVKLGQILAAQGEYENALDVLITAAELDKPTAREIVRPLMVHIFHILGVRSETSDAYRSRLQSLLY